MRKKHELKGITPGAVAPGVSKSANASEIVGEEEDYYAEIDEDDPLMSAAKRLASDNQSAMSGSRSKKTKITT